MLDAFDFIWRAGNPLQLVIVGRVGWKVDSLVSRLRTHPETRNRLHWFDDADDGTLHALYEAASGVLIASEGEGFGMPLLEAAAHGKPLLVRDLPVFREIAKEGATYFGGYTPERIAAEITAWARKVEDATAVSSAVIPRPSWAQSAQQLLALLPL
jgi:glycosyltransferase involved in cell wall biosynthesis